MRTIELFGFAVSPHVRAARIALREKGVEITFREIGFDDLRSDSYGRINPLRKMPALVHGDFVLYETPALLTYADGIGTGSPLQPEDVALRARMWQFIGIAQSHLYPVGVMQLYFHNVLAGLFGIDPDRAVADAAVAPTHLHLDVLESALVDDHLVGGRLTLADLYCGAMVDYVARTRAGRSAIDARPKTARWLETLRSRPSFSETLAPMLVGADQQ